MEFMKQNCRFDQPTEHLNYMYPFAKGNMYCKDSGNLTADGTPTEAVLEWKLCYSKGMDYCSYMGLQYDYGLVTLEFPTGSGKQLIYPTCCTCQKHYDVVDNSKLAGLLSSTVG